MLTVINLEENHRQGEDREFADMLNRIRVLRKGELSTEDAKRLQTRVRKSGHPDMDGASINIVCTRWKCAQMNTKYLESVEGEEVTIKSINYKKTQKRFTPPLHKFNGTIHKTGFMNELKVKVGVKVMMIHNVDTADSQAHSWQSSKVVKEMLTI